MTIQPTSCKIVSGGQTGAEQADLAMAWLRKAVAAGFKEAELMKKGSDLDALRENSEFKALLTELTKGNSSGAAYVKDAVPVVDLFFREVKAAVAGAHENRR